MKGVTIISDDKKGVTLCLVDNLSGELKGELRKKLISICEGEYHAKRFSDFFDYKSTLNTFLERYKSKTDEIKIGMIGELLCHLLIPKKFKNLKVMSPFYNLEEGAIKKGHDLIYIDKTNTVDMWIVEVKSGELGSAKNVKSKKKALLSTSKRDLKDKLTSRKTNLWRNALKGMDTVISNGVTKKKLEKILKNYRDKTQLGVQDQKEYKVIFASSLFHTLEDRVKIEDIIEWGKDNLKSDEYKEMLVFSIQKNTYQEIVNFLENEVVLEDKEFAS